MAVIVPDTDYSMSLIWTNVLTSKEFTCGLGFHQETGGPDAPSDVADALYGIVTDSGVNLCDASNMAVGWHFEGVSGFMATSGGPVLGSHLEVVNGTGSDNDVPVNCAVLVRKNTASGGRRNRGRMFLPPMMSGMTADTDGSFGGVTQAYVDAGLEQIHDLMITAGYVPVIHHSDGDAGTAISSFSTQALLATQRKRMR